MKFTGNFLGSFVTGILIACSLCSIAHAERIFFADLDDSTFESREELQGTFETPYVLYRIDMRASTAQALPSGPKTIEVTPNELDRLKRHLGHGNHQPGNLNMKFRLRNGTEIVPGDYQILSPETFEYFFSMPPNTEKEHVNYFLRDLKAAIKRSKTGWRGGLWPLVKKLLSKPETVKELRFITARAISKEDWDEAWDYLVKIGEINYRPIYEIAHFVGDPKYDRYDVHANIAKRKVAVISDTAMAMARVPLDESGELHEIYLADDSQVTDSLAFEVFQNLARSKRTNSRFAVLNMGTEAEVLASHRPRLAIIEQDGTFRPATKKELLGLDPGECEAYFTAAKGKGR